MAESELMLCVVCSMDMTPWSVADRETHLNACLDSATTELRYDCPTCGRELSHCDERQRMEHVNLCLDRAEAAGDDIHGHREEEDGDIELLQTQVVEQTQVTELQDEEEAAEVRAEEAEDYDSESECSYLCKICGADMSEDDLMRRICHVKQCGQKFGVRPGDMAEVEPAETIAARLAEEKKAPNAFAIMMKSSAGKSDTQTTGIGTDGVP